jgi:hypothetical protein
VYVFIFRKTGRRCITCILYLGKDGRKVVSLREEPEINSKSC